MSHVFNVRIQRSSKSSVRICTGGSNQTLTIHYQVLWYRVATSGYDLLDQRVAFYSVVIGEGPQTPILLGVWLRYLYVWCMHVLAHVCVD